MCVLNVGNGATWLLGVGPQPVDQDLGSLGRVSHVVKLDIRQQGAHNRSVLSINHQSRGQSDVITVGVWDMLPNNAHLFPSGVDSSSQVTLHDIRLIPQGSRIIQPEVVPEQLVDQHHHLVRSDVLALCQQLR